MDIRIISAAACIALAGCMPIQPRAPVPMGNVFTVEDHAAYIKAGTGALAGQAFLRQQGGGVVTCAGSQVMLFPATPYFREVLLIMRSGDTPIINRQFPEMAVLDRRSQCDAQGNFVFTGLPAGRYIVLTQVQWMVGYHAQGGVVGREVDVPETGTANALLSDADRM